jgi:phosphoglycolate phosphatase-like HAD superfamily hydrolase
MIIFDLDGTLIDSSERMYRLFQDLVPESTFSKEEYWRLKRNKINHKIETEKYMLLDQNYPDTLEVLANLKHKGEYLCLLTARQSRTMLMQELERLKIDSYLDRVLTTEHKCTKVELFQSLSSINTQEDFAVSDMGIDILNAKQYGYHTVAITHGFMNEKNLSTYHPDRIIHELAELLLI